MTDSTILAPFLDNNLIGTFEGCQTTVDMSNVEDVSAVPKTEHSREGSFSSQASSPELELDEHTSIAENVQVQKRKGGRKPVCRRVRSVPIVAVLTVGKIYATSEERKQRNRQAQAAFRERRTEYIKQLETNIKHQDETLQNLQQSHRAAADECLMLRYKNSLLERILLEKGNGCKSSNLIFAAHEQVRHRCSSGAQNYCRADRGQAGSVRAKANHCSTGNHEPAP